VKIGDDHAVHNATNIVKRGEGECGDNVDDDGIDDGIDDDGGEVERWQAARAARMLSG
jgi:hypothetical protein